MKTIMRIFSVVLLVMIGVVFMVGPAQLIALLTPDAFGVQFWTIVVLIYYFLATLLPIDKIIGKDLPSIRSSSYHHGSWNRWCNTSTFRRKTNARDLGSL